MNRRPTSSFSQFLTVRIKVELQFDESRIFFDCLLLTYSQSIGLGALACYNYSNL